MQPNIIYSKRPETKISRNSKGAIVRIDGEAADILESFCSKSGLSARKLASEFIKYAADNTIIQYSEDNDD